MSHSSFYLFSSVNLENKKQNMFCGERGYLAQVGWGKWLRDGRGE
jgi:hypothetical protein